MENNRNKKIEDILGSLDNTKRAAAPDFFYTRLKAKMEKGFEPAAPRAWILRPAYALVAILLVLVINAAVIVNSNTAADNGVTATADNTESFQSIAAEYSLNDNNTLYDLNPDK
jgi:uncharacterized membrane protein